MEIGITSCLESCGFSSRDGFLLLLRRGGGLTFRDFHCKLPFTFLPSPPEMLESNNLVTFEGLANSSAYHTFLLDEERGRLVVGAKDHIFSFNLLNVSRDYAKVTQTKGLTNLSLVVLPARPFCPAVSLFALLTDLSAHLPPRVPVRSAGIPGFAIFFPLTQKCLINISERSCCTRSHAVPGMLDALWPPG